MLGLGSIGAALAFWLSIAAAALCVVYGIVNWNNKGPSDVEKFDPKNPSRN
ncbi:MAG: symporter small accessory protein [Thermodesulfobacteriota bacterium]